MITLPDRQRVSALRQWRALDELLSALASECETGHLPHQAFATAAAEISKAELPGILAARRANDLLLNPFQQLSSNVHPDLHDICQVLAHSYDLALTAGASLAAASLQAQEHASARAHEMTTLAEEVAGAKLSAVTLMLLPGVGLLLGPLIGANPLVWLCTTSGGRVILLIGLAVQGLGWLWSRTILRRALNPGVVGPGQLSKARGRLAADDHAASQVIRLLAVATAGGGHDTTLSACVINILNDGHGRTAMQISRRITLGESFADIAQTTADMNRQWRHLLAVLARCEQSGADPSSALKSLARRVTRDEQSVRLQRIRRAGVWVLLPLGFCGLPAFLLLTVTPLLMSYFAGLDLWRR